ncbi:hypothetical protein OROGR_002618 [Orobanche gracilis]
MEPAVAGRKSFRGRKRKRIIEPNVMAYCNDESNGVKTRSLRLVGRYVLKEFQYSGVFLGRIMLYKSGFYRINYENGNFENLDSSEVKTLLVEDGDLTGEWFERKKKLDNSLNKDVNTNVLNVENTQELENAGSSLFEMSSGDAGANKVVEVNNDCNSDAVADCLRGSCENTQGYADLDMEVPLVPPPELPSSSGHIGIPEELSSDGSELASKCLRCLNWSLLDTLTWPIYLVHYLILMDNRNGQNWKGFYIHSLERDYYSLSVGTKLIVMQTLCECVLDSEELRIALDLRQESEVGIDIDTNSTVTCKSRRAGPGYSKISFSKDMDAIQIVAEPETKSVLDGHSMESQVGGPVGNSIDEDGNGDECRLCGMDGLLVCCDGCPSSYHSRCLGLNKMFMPDGSWYCPECKINATEPKIPRRAALRGGYVFAVDPYEQVFVASCDHLLVLMASNNSENCSRYYNRHDIPGVLRALYSKQDHVTAYSEICRGIMRYWEIPQTVFPCNDMSEVGLQSEHEEGIAECSTQLIALLDKDPEMTEVENHGSCVISICPDISASNRQQSGVIRTASSSSSIGQPYDLYEISQQITSSNLTETITNVPRSSNVICSNPMTVISLEPKASIPCQDPNSKADRKGSQSDCCFYMGSSFKPAGYINYYLHGDFAASAAANLAILSSEENQVISRSSVNHRKVLCANVALQVKALSAAATRFFWPTMEKKLVEIPRERCGWCFSCKAAVSSKRGCLLNAAASNATRGSMKVLVGLRPVKNGDERLRGIATYIMFMEESLSGLLSGPFLSDRFRKQWRKQVDEATSCNAIKIRLLELEENVRTIALSGDWTKIIEGSSSQSSISQIAASAAGSTEKHKLGRRGKKPSAVVEVAVDASQDVKTGFTWWRGGRLSKLIFQREILPCSTIKKSARQGGSKEILGIHYVEGNDTPRSSKQLVWRSAVEISRNMAQLALQVRYLDFHLRFSDFVRPEESNCDGKGLGAEARAFRNAFICGKKIVEGEIRYSVAFGSQKHLPSRVKKNIAEVEQILGDGKEKYWFSETFIPLYLIKEYEQKVEQNKPVDVLSKLQRQTKASHRSIFSDLLWKQNNIVRSCCSCHEDVFYRNVVKCTECQGFCHDHCATSSAVNMGKEVEFLITCKQCQTEATTQVQSRNRSPTSPLLLQGRDFRNPCTATKRVKSIGYQGSSASVKERSSEVKSTNRSAGEKKNRKLPTGLIWKKNNCEDTGIDFRLKNILLRAISDTVSIKPVCRLCSQPYNADLMYIHCQTCQYWFHADAVELDETKIFLLVGFKCCKCRRIRSPICPYLDPYKKTTLEDKTECKQTKQAILAADYGEKNNSTASGSEPMKLPLRRHTNQEKKDVFSDLVDSNVVNSVQENFDDAITLDYDSLGCDDVDSKPQTYFSSNELPASDDDSGRFGVDGNKYTENVTEIENEKTLEILHSEDSILSFETTVVQRVPCEICSNVEPLPDLSCRVCGIWIHGRCSPWFETSTWEDEWRCGSCREWR